MCVCVCVCVCVSMRCIILNPGPADGSTHPSPAPSSSAWTPPRCGPAGPPCAALNSTSTFHDHGRRRTASRCVCVHFQIPPSLVSTRGNVFFCGLSARPGGTTAPPCGRMAQWLVSIKGVPLIYCNYSLDI